MRLELQRPDVEEIGGFELFGQNEIQEGADQQRLVLVGGRFEFSRLRGRILLCLVNRNRRLQKRKNRRERESVLLEPALEEVGTGIGVEIETNDAAEKIEKEALVAPSGNLMDLLGVFYPGFEEIAEGGIGIEGGAGEHHA